MQPSGTYGAKIELGGSTVAVSAEISLQYSQIISCSNL
jgi:hypothetical protein